MQQNTVFISYRRALSKHLARSIYMDLKMNGWDVFLDVNTIDSGDFDRIILNQIAARAHFILLISPGSLERCANSGDWVLREIQEAVRLGRNIVPIVEEGAEFTREMGYLPSDLRAIVSKKNALPLPHFFFDPAMEMLRTRFLKTPEYVQIQETPATERAEVQKRLKQVESVEDTPTPPQKSVGAQHVAPAAPAEAVRAILGEPFDWCAVPTGEFLYGNHKQKLTLPTFHMAKYPITYSQFQVFIDDRQGFRDDRWWDGLAAGADHRRQPGNQEWKVKDHPSEMVSWYDAMAFTRWLSWKLGGGYAADDISSWLVRLPTEFEWEKAARGTDGLMYPWGNKYIEGYANIDETVGNVGKNYLKRTTPVTEYPQGASPYGVFGMSGNVWEWCLTDYFNPAEHPEKENISSNSSRVLRGGSWDGDSNVARAVDRFDDGPDDRFSNYGFRILRPPSLES